MFLQQARCIEKLISEEPHIRPSAAEVLHSELFISKDEVSEHYQSHISMTDFVCWGLTSEVISRLCLLVAVVYFDYCAATQEAHATDTGHDTSRRHSIQTQGLPVIVLSFDVECHTKIHNYPF